MRSHSPTEGGGLRDNIFDLRKPFGIHSDDNGAYAVTGKNAQCQD